MNTNIYFIKKRTTPYDVIPFVQVISPAHIIDIACNDYISHMEKPRNNL